MTRCLTNLDKTLDDLSFYSHSDFYNKYFWVFSFTSRGCNCTPLSAPYQQFYISANARIFCKDSINFYFLDFLWNKKMFSFRHYFYYLVTCMPPTQLTRLTSPKLVFFWKVTHDNVRVNEVCLSQELKDLVSKILNFQTIVCSN